MKNELNRTKAASINALTMVLTQAISLILKFGVQTVFIQQLSQSYLGLNGLFSNIISFLSFADLGIGTAITVALYKPIATGDTRRLRILMYFYKKTYEVIIGAMFVIGLAISPWIYVLIKNSNFSKTQLSFWFIAYLASTMATYFSAHKRSFLMATQQGYLNSLNDFLFKSIQQVIQIILIYFFQSFSSFLVVQMLAAICANIQLSRMVSRHYPKVFEASKKENLKQLDKGTLRHIKRNVAGAISSKVGSIIVFGTDNIILSAFIGLSAVAKYSNYTLIVQSISSLFAQVISSFVGSIGNLHATSSIKKQEEVIYRLLYINTLVNLFVTVGLSTAINGFITIWAGNGYLLSLSVTIGIVINCSINLSRTVVQNFISGMGLYWFLRWKSLIEACVNLFLSLLFILVFKVGILGVVLGTLGSNCLINLFWEPYIVFHEGLHISMRQFLLKYTFYELFIIFASISLIFFSTGFGTTGLFSLIWHTCLAEIILFFVFIGITCRTKEFKYLERLIITILKQRF